MKNQTVSVAVLLILMGVSTAAAPSTPAPADDPAMLALASRSGCLTCHSVKSQPSADLTTKPIGPAWQDVAVKYRGQHDAPQKLLATVMSGSNPYASHWSGKVSGLAMPPNEVAISSHDAEQLVNWILSLD
jgi:cytochrome c